MECEVQAPDDKLVVEVTHAKLENGKYTSYVRVVWGDMDDVGGHFSIWDGSLTITGGTGLVDAKYHFNEAKPGTPQAALATRPDVHGPDVLIKGEGPEIVWKAAVHGAYDGLRIKITSDNANVSGTIVAGKFTVPVKIAAAPAPTAK